MRVLVTGGPTRAYLDRVRYLSNLSTGRLAYVLCRRLCRAGVKVYLVAGPTEQPFSELPLAGLSQVETGEEMHREVLKACRKFRPDAAVFTAAVLDFAPARRQEGKVATRDGTWTLTLKPTPKIIDDVAKKFPKVSRFGFKLEWKGGSRKAREAFGRQLLARKGYQGLCLNFLSELGGKTGAEKHPAYLFPREGKMETARTKEEIADWLVRRLRALGR